MCVISKNTMYYKKDEWLNGEKYTKYQRAIQEIGLEEKQYKDWISQVLDVFPPEDPHVQRELEKVEKYNYSYMDLHPPYSQWLKLHPVPPALEGQVNGNRILTELLKLGRDLKHTENIEKIDFIRKRLKHLNEYPGALFELEVLAALVREGMNPSIVVDQDKNTSDFKIDIKQESFQLEIKHRKPSKARNAADRISYKINQRLISEDKDLECRINLYLKTSSPKDSKLIKKILGMVAEEDNENAREFISDEFEIRINPNESSGFNCEWKEQSDPEEVYQLVKKSLNKKRRKQNPDIIALDIRTLIPFYASEKGETYKNYVQSCLQKALRAGNDFLASTEEVEAVLLWYRKGHSDLSDIVFNYNTTIFLGPEDSNIAQLDFLREPAKFPWIKNV